LPWSDFAAGASADLSVVPSVLVAPLRRSNSVARGHQFVTLENAGNYVTKLPKAEHTAPEWQAAMQALMLVATPGGPTMFARIRMLRALNRRVERVFNPDRKDTHWEKRKL
jgi:hypothetical protein